MKAEAKHDTTRLNLNVSQGMLRAHMKWALAAALMSVLATTPAAAGDDKYPGLKVFGLTAEQELVKFRSKRPGRLRVIGVVSPLQAPDTDLVGIDFRVQDGQLYGVGNAGGIYTIDTTTATPTWVSQLSVPLDGAFFGVDFNPAADRLRIVSDTGQNLRHNVNLGGVTTVDANLTYTQPPIVPAPYIPVTTLGVTGAAYTNNDLDTTTGTTLFDIDTALDQVIIQSPPNNGILVATGKLTVDTDAPVGFDIYTRLKKSVASGNSGFASLMVGGVSGFYRVSLLTGMATRIGNFHEPIADIAVRLNQ
ncbi:MAG: DUF4394 domain-containing protein [Gammaproteobacteria bacterium]